MKKVLLSLALLAGISTASHAQSGALKYGVKGGFNLSSYFGSGAGDTGYKPGFAVGVLGNYGLSDMVSLQLEALYSQKGAFVENYTPVGALKPVTDLQFRSTVQYIDVPVLLKVTTGTDGKGFFFELGPQASFLVATRDFTRAAGSGAGSNETELNTKKDNLNSVAAGYVGGLGYQITSGLGLGIRFTGDLTHTYKEHYDPYTPLATVVPNNNFRNNTFQFQVHYLFGGK